MTKYTFKFESVKNVKKTLEKKTQKELAEINIKIEKTHEEIRKVEEEKISTIKMMKESRNIKISELQNYIGRTGFLDDVIKNYKKQIIQLQINKEKKIAELEQKCKEHKIFSKLDEISYAEHVTDNNRKEQVMLDELASKKKEAKQ